jgi:hypothetical protein
VGRGKLYLNQRKNKIKTTPLDLEKAKNSKFRKEPKD